MNSDYSYCFYSNS